jgi:hypothetical protein
LFYRNTIDIIITLRYYKAKEGGRAMAVTEAQKKATAKYEKENPVPINQIVYRGKVIAVPLYLEGIRLPS